MPQDFLAAIDAAYEAASTDSPPTPGVVRASSLGHQPRRLAFELDPDAPREKLLPRARRTFEVGDQRHDALRAKIAAAYPGSPIPLRKDDEGTFEAPLVDGWIIRGHPDGLITDEVFNRGRKVPGPVLLEIKTVNALGWRDATAGKIDPRYLATSAWYARAADASSRVFLLERKDTQHLHAVFLPLLEPLLEPALEWARQAVGRVGEAMSLPECRGEDYGWRPHKTFGRALAWRCSYCPFASTCFPNHVRVVDKGRPVCIAEESTPADAFVVSYGSAVVPRGTWQFGSPDDE